MATFAECSNHLSSSVLCDGLHNGYSLQTLWQAVAHLAGGAAIKHWLMRLHIRKSQIRNAI